MIHNKIANMPMQKNVMIKFGNGMQFNGNNETEKKCNLQNQEKEKL